MNTPLGEIEVCDAHAHFFSRRFFEVLAGQAKNLPAAHSVEQVLEKLEWEAPPEDNAALARRWVEELDRHGVGRIALMASVPGDEESVIEAIEAFPDRIYGFFMLNPLAPDAPERAARALHDGMRGICLFPAMLRFSVKDDRLKPIYELAASLPGAVVFVHMGVLTVGVRRRLGLTSHFDMSYSNPIDLHAVALEHANVNFIIPHFGAGFFREALMLGDLAPNVYLDTSSSNSWVRYRMPTATLSQVFEKALEIYGPRRLLFGSDSSYFPRGWNREIFDRQLRALQDLGLPSEDARAILGGNLKTLLERPDAA